MNVEWVAELGDSKGEMCKKTHRHLSESLM